MLELKEGVFSVGAIDWDRRLFDELIPLPDGTSYNSYLIKGSEKTALLDTVDPAKTEVLVDNLVKTGVERIDYLVAHHAEQDHSGSLPEMLLLHPEAKVVTNQKCKQMLMELLEISEDNFLTISDGQSLSLGNKTLQFFDIPWVHWPETMCTYVKEDKILYSCDFFGSHYATGDVFVEDDPVVFEAAKRYYAEIMMPFRGPIKRNLEKIDKLDIDLIAPSHGPVYKKPKLIIDAYKGWVGDEVKNEVVIAYVSMHESTRKMVEFLAEALIERGIGVKFFNLATVDTGKLAISLVDAATVIFGSPTVLTGAHPSVVYAAALTNVLRPKVKFAGVVGSYGWAGKTAEQIQGLISSVKAEILEPVMAKGFPTDSDFEALEKLADLIKSKHESLNL